MKTHAITILISAFFLFSCAAKKSTPEDIPEKLEPQKTYEEKPQIPDIPEQDEVSKDKEKESDSAEKVVETSKISKKAVDVNSPKEVIKRYTSELQSLVDPEDETKPMDEQKEEEIAEKVRGFFDFPGLARMSLGHHWKKISKKQRAEFSDLFIDLIEESYLRRSRSVMGDYDIQYTKEEIKEGQATVVSSVARSDADVDIVYELHKIDGNWMIFNIILDNVDLIRNYQSQFNSIIAKSSFDGLLERMRKKQEEIKNGDKNEI